MIRQHVEINLENLENKPTSYKEGKIMMVTTTTNQTPISNNGNIFRKIKAMFLKQQ